MTEKQRQDFHPAYQLTFLFSFCAGGSKALERSAIFWKRSTWRDRVFLFFVSKKNNVKRVLIGHVCATSSSSDMFNFLPVEHLYLIIGYWLELIYNINEFKETNGDILYVDTFCRSP